MGKGRPILCLHAVGHDSRDFIPLAERIGDRFEIIAPDWPGHGMSERNTVGPEARRYGALALELLDTLELSRVAVIGNSIGGAAALCLAATAPDRLTALVLCNAGGLAALDPVSRFAIGRMVALYRAGEQGAGWFDRVFELYYRHGVLTGRPAAARRAEIIAKGRALAPLLREAWEGFADQKSDLRTSVAGLPMPVLYAWAKGDQFVSWSRAKSAARTAPNHQVKLFPGSHSPFLEAPDAFARALEGFLGTTPTLGSIA
jgi:pimeloyl-ACP methyl ester carboxylesterase